MARRRCRSFPETITFFWSHVKKKGHDDCWVWSGRPNHGYGRLDVLGETRGAPHFSFFLFHGRWPSKKLDLAHSCDTKMCVNPFHLEEVAHSQNIQDAWDRKMISKKRHSASMKRHWRTRR